MQQNKISPPLRPGWAEKYVSMSSHPNTFLKDTTEQYVQPLKSEEKGAKLECTTAKVKGGRDLVGEKEEDNSQ